MIFVPGVGERDSTDEAALGFATKLAAALDHNAKDVRAVFTASSRLEDMRRDLGGKSVFVSTISRIEPDGSKLPVLDIYKLAYRDVFESGYERLSSFVRVFVTGLAALAGGARIVRALSFRGRGNRIRLLQVLCACTLWIVLVAYLVLLLSALGTALASYLKNSGQPERFPAFFNWAHGEVAHHLLLLATLVGTVVPTKVKSEMLRLGGNYVRMCNYLSVNQERSALVGRFYGLLEHVLESSPNRTVHVAAYSFGSVVALDAIFPPKEIDAKRSNRLDSLGKLITIGCPHDFIASLWPSYFDGRIVSEGAPREWLNVVCPADALASTFQSSDNNFQKVRPKDLFYGGRGLGWIDYLTFIALRSHEIYFNLRSEAQDQGCLREMVGVAFNADPMLG